MGRENLNIEEDGSFKMCAKEYKISVDSKNNPLSTQPHVGHNRWHPELKPILSIDVGDSVEIECLDGWDVQFNRNSTSDDINKLVFERIHPLTGPIYVNGAEPGDLLEVTFLEIKPGDFGTALIVPGFGMLRDYFKNPFLTRWEIDGEYAVSEDLAKVRIPGQSFMGNIGVAPSLELMNKISKREKDLVNQGGIALLPNPNCAIPFVEPIASEGLRTITPKEVGGNIDNKWLTKGATIFLPVSVPGALFSIGDGHFSQGDGESSGTAIETNCTVKAKFGLLKGEAEKRQIKSIEFTRKNYNITPGIKKERPFYATTGICVEDENINKFEDITLAAKNALLSMIEYISKVHGYSREEACVLCGIIVDLKIIECVDIPNVMVGAFLPLDIFE